MRYRNRKPVNKRVKKFIRKIVPNCIMDSVYALWHYGRCHRTVPNLLNPQTFNEKVLYKKIFDKRPILGLFADKVKVRSYVAERIGSECLTELYEITPRPEDVNFLNLPKSFVVKPSHGSGWVELVQDKILLDKEALLEKCYSWLDECYYDITREWVYRDIEHLIMFEEYIGGDSKVVPNDYKFFVFDGSVRLIQVDTGRFGEHCRSFFDDNFNEISLQYGTVARPISGAVNVEGVLVTPHLEEMKNAAAILGQGIDFVRVDFYDTKDKFYFGELTNFPGSGLRLFNPKSYDVVFGEYWKLFNKG